MIQLHHLEASRSQRILWLLEELALELGRDYEIVRYARDPKTRRAPESMRAAHPLGKSPILCDGDVVLAESGAIVDYLLVRHAGKANEPLAPAHDDPVWPRYVFWLHFAEGSAAFPLVLGLLLGMTGAGDSLLAGLAKGEAARMLDFVDGELDGREWLAGPRFSAADVMMGFPIEFAAAQGLLGERANLVGWMERIRARPAWRRAEERGA